MLVVRGERDGSRRTARWRSGRRQREPCTESGFSAAVAGRPWQGRSSPSRPVAGPAGPRAHNGIRSANPARTHAQHTGAIAAPSSGPARLRHRRPRGCEPSWLLRWPTPARAGRYCVAAASSACVSSSSVMLAAATFCSRWAKDEVPGISKTLGARPSSQAIAIWAGVGQAAWRCCVGSIASTGLAWPKPEPSGKNGTKAIPARSTPRGSASKRDWPGSAGSARTRWACGPGAQQVATADVAQADAPDQPFVACVDHGGQLVVESLVWARAVDESQVDGGQLPGAEAAQVVLDSAPQLIRFVDGASPRPRRDVLRPCSPAPGCPG